jgi:hypothetical protein
MRMLFLALIAVCACSACSKSTVASEEELEIHIADENHGLVKTADVDDISIRVAFRPTELLVAQELGQDEPDSATLNRLYKKYSRNLYFIMSLSKRNAEALHSLDSYEEYSELLQVMSFRMNEFTTLTTSENDTIPVADFLINRTYGLASSTDLLFVFPREKIKDDEWIQFKISEFGLKTGLQTFEFLMSDIDAVPGIDRNSWK